MNNRNYGFLDQLSLYLDSKNTDRILEFLTDDCLLQAGNSEIVKGKEGIKQIFDSFFPNVKNIEHDLTDSFENGNSVVYRGTVTYTRLDDSTLTVPVCDVFKMEDNLIKEYYIYIDWSELFK